MNIKKISLNDFKKCNMCGNPAEVRVQSQEEPFTFYLCDNDLTKLATGLMIIIQDIDLEVKNNG